jgi:hypothetical protein
LWRDDLPKKVISLRQTRALPSHAISTALIYILFFVNSKVNKHPGVIQFFDVVNIQLPRLRFQSAGTPPSTSTASSEQSSYIQLKQSPVTVRFVVLFLFLSFQIFVIREMLYLTVITSYFYMRAHDLHVGGRFKISLGYFFAPMTKTRT